MQTDVDRRAQPAAPAPHSGELRFVNRLLGFSPAVEARFERDTGEARVAHLRRSIVIGLMFYDTYCLSDLLLRPEVAWVAIGLRLLLITPVSLGLAWAVGRVSAGWRETLMTFGMINVSALPILLFWLSDERLNGYAFIEIPLTFVFGAMMLVLRFPQTLLYLSVTLAMTLVAIAAKASLGFDLAAAYILQAVTGASFVLYGNHLVEFARRTAFLTALGEILRSEELETDRREFAALSSTDALTGLANRRRLDAVLADWDAAAREERPVIGVVMIDVDHFKLFNDAYGHLSGDACLRRVAAAIAAHVRDDRDLAVRYGGEEFVVLMRSCDEASLAQAAERLRGAIEALCIPHRSRADRMPFVTASLGAACTQGFEACTTEALLAGADAALYRSKRAGRNRASVGSLDPPRPARAGGAEAA